MPHVRARVSAAINRRLSLSEIIAELSDLSTDLVTDTYDDLRMETFDAWLTDDGLARHAA